MCVIDGGIAMELVLQKGLKHQQDAVNAISEVFTGVEITPPNALLKNCRKICQSSTEVSGGLPNI
jgi:hypothetical protein